MKTRVLSFSSDSVALARNALSTGQLVAIPTETVYGLAANAFDVDAILEVYRTKARPSFDPCIVHFSPKKVGPAYEDWVSYGIVGPSPFHLLSRTSTLLAEAFWPGPLTFVLPRGLRISDLVTSGLPRVAIRAPRHPFTESLLEALDFPLIAPSANPFGRISPTRSEDVVADFEGKIPFVLDGGPCEIGVESTVLLLDPELGIRILRPGAVTIDQLESALRKHDLWNSWAQLELGVVPLSTLSSQQNLAPGMLPSHYAPRKTLYRLPKPLSQISRESFASLVEPFGENYAILLFSIDESGFKTRFAQDPVLLRVLKGNHSSIARDLFSSLRALDQSDAKILITEPFLDTHDLGSAIKDRLERASKPFPNLKEPL